jgi:hypothetical protein
MDAGLQSCQSMGRVRGMNHIAIFATEDAMKSVFTANCKTLFAAFPQTLKVPAVIPTSRFLTDIAPNGSLIAKLGACHFGGRLGQRGVAPFDVHVFP